MDVREIRMLAQQFVVEPVAQLSQHEVGHAKKRWERAQDFVELGQLFLHGVAEAIFSDL